MNRNFSLYLDAVRFIAAFTVFLYHSNGLYDTGLWLSQFGHEAVIVFFFLSGYVIAFVSEGKERTLRDYFLARAARIYSVALPAILLTLIVDLIGNSLAPEAYGKGYQTWDWEGARVAAALFFMNETWFSIQLFSNVPYWSLSYEVWFYISFGVVFYLPSKAGKILFCGAVLVMGPKIVLLMPLWWAGYFCYRNRVRLTTPRPLAIVIVAASVGLFSFYGQYGLRGLVESQVSALVGAPIYTSLAFSRWFISDYFLVLAVALNFIGVYSLTQGPGWQGGAVAKAIRFLSASTFSLYLLHQPLLLLFYAIFYQGTVTFGGYMLIMTLTLFTIFLVSEVTEKKKNNLKQILDRALTHSMKMLRPSAA